MHAGHIIQDDGSPGVSLGYTWTMLRCAPDNLLMRWFGVALCAAAPAAPAGSAPVPAVPSIFPVSVTLNDARFRQTVSETLGREVKRGVAKGEVYDGAVTYSLNWRVDMSRASVSLRNSGTAVLMELAATLNLSPAFSLSKGAETIYRASGCGRTNVSLLFSVELSARDGKLASVRRPVSVAFARGYRCVYDRNFVGDLRNLFTADTRKQVDVVPLMLSGIKAKVDYLAGQLATSVSAIADSDSLRQRLDQQLFKPLQISRNLWLWAKIRKFDISAVGISNGKLSLRGKLEALPRFGFGKDPPRPQEEPSGAASGDDRFYLPFNLLIPRGPLVTAGSESIEMSSPGYRFRALEGAPGIAALERFQANLEEDVVLLEGRTHTAGERIPMAGPIDAVLDEIVVWLESNAGVRTAAASSVDRLLREVRRVASLVAHFQRARTIPLGALGGVTLSDLSADLQWVSLERNSIRAGVLLNGRAMLNIEL